MSILKILKQLKIIRLLNIFRKTKRKKVLGSVLLLFVLYLTVFRNDFPEDVFGFNHVNVSCYYSNNNDSLSSIEHFFPTSRSIFFHETSCKGYLSESQSCSIESAARAHPNRKVYVLFSGPVTRYNLNLDSFLILKTYKNINFARLYVNDYVKSTPLAEILDVPLESRWNRHFLHVLRYVTLYKFGGIYIDLDVIVARNLDSLSRNWAARVSDNEVSSDILAISKDDVGMKISKAIIKDISKIYHSRWKHNRPNIMTEVLQEICSIQKPSFMSAATCGDFEVYGPQFFYPVERQNARRYFTPGELNIQDPYTYHIWSDITKDFKVAKGSPYEKLAKKYCPSTYNLYINKFEFS